MKKLIVILLIWLPLTSFGQQKSKYLLSDLQVQLESTEAVNDMYNFKFDKANAQFRWLKFKYPNHPLPYFLLGLNEWWKIVPNVDVTRYDQKLIAYMDTSIMFAEAIHQKEPNNIEAKFFLAASHGFKGRLYSDRKNWRKAAFSGKAAYEYMQQTRGMEEFGPEFLFGDGLYNYYSIWIPENYPLLKPVLSMFPKGNKETGIKQLKQVANNAFFTRTEAQCYLARIYAIEENRADLAYPIIEYLHNTFPDNAYFHRFFARLAYTQGYLDLTEKLSLGILDKINNNIPGYEAVSGRYACFYLGYISKFKHKDNNKAKVFFGKAVKFAEESNATESGYYHYSLLYLGRISEEEKNLTAARSYYTLVKDKADSDSEAYRDAKQYLKNLSTKGKKPMSTKARFFKFFGVDIE